MSFFRLTLSKCCKPWWVSQILRLKCTSWVTCWLNKRRWSTHKLKWISLALKKVSQSTSDFASIAENCYNSCQFFSFFVSHAVRRNTFWWVKHTSHPEGIFCPFSASCCLHTNWIRCVECCSDGALFVKSRLFSCQSSLLVCLSQLVFFYLLITRKIAKKYLKIFLEKEGTIEDAVERGENRRGKRLSEIIDGCKVCKNS